MTLLQNNKSFLDSICSFKLGLLNAISEASRIIRIRLFSGTANKIFQENLWLKFSLKCFAGSESLLMFFPSQFYIMPRFANVCLLTNTYPLKYDTWCMWIPTFWFEKLFDFPCNPFYSNFVWIVGKFMKVFNETFWKWFISRTTRNLSQK